MTIPRPPQQPVVLVDGEPHFLPNLLVIYLAKRGRVDVMKILSNDGRFSDDDARQFQQLLGIKISEYERLPYVYSDVLEPYRDAEPSDLTPFEPLLEAHVGFQVRTGPRDADVRAFGGDLPEASRYFGEAYARWKQRVDEQQDYGPSGFKQPMQPIAGMRFRKNVIVDYLLDHGGVDLNHLARQTFPREDQMQFAQLIGYSLTGYGELSYVADESYEAACEAAVQSSKSR